MDSNWNGVFVLPLSRSQPRRSCDVPTSRKTPAGQSIRPAGLLSTTRQSSGPSTSPPVQANHPPIGRSGTFTAKSSEHCQIVGYFHNQIFILESNNEPERRGATAITKWLSLLTRPIRLKRLQGWHRKTPNWLLKIFTIIQDSDRNKKTEMNLNPNPKSDDMP